MPKASKAHSGQVQSGEADALMSAHSQVALVEFHSPEAVEQVIGELEAQLTVTTDRLELVEARVREINAATGVLIPFGIWRCWRVLDPSKAERLVHSALNEFRVRGDREFFSIDVAEASSKILIVLQEHNLLLRTLDNLAALGI